MEPDLVYSESEVFALCLAARRAGCVQEFFDMHLRFETCPNVPVPLGSLLFTCNIISKLHNERVQGLK